MKVRLALDFWRGIGRDSKPSVWILSPGAPESTVPGTEQKRLVVDVEVPQEMLDWIDGADGRTEGRPVTPEEIP